MTVAGKTTRDGSPKTALTLLFLAMATVASGCGGGGGGGGGSPFGGGGSTSGGSTSSGSSNSSQVQIQGGDQQQAEVGTALPLPLAVVVTTGGVPSVGVNVSFQVATGAATLGASDVPTDVNGVAQTTVTLSNTSGRVTIAARANNQTATFTATGTPGAPASIQLVSGNNQTAVIGTALSGPLVLTVRDAQNNPVPGVDVRFEVTAGGGTIEGAAIKDVVADARGQAFAAYTVGPAEGANSVAASLPGTQVAPIAFDSMGSLAPPPTPLNYAADVAGIMAAKCVSCHAAGFFFGPLTTYAQVRNGATTGGQPFVIPGDPAGSAVVQKTAAGGTMAAYVSAAEAQLISDWVLAGALEGTVAVPTTVQVESGNNQSAAINTAAANPCAVVVRDGSGQPVANTLVNWAVTSGGGSVSATTSLTDLTGVATATLTVGPAAGPNTLTATVTGIAPASFTVTGALSYSGAPLAGSQHPLDVAALAALRANFVEPAPLSSDSEFIRRVTSDLVGRLPSEQELADFEASTRNDKRRRVIDGLLNTSEFAAHWTQIMANWLEVRPVVDVNGTDRRFDDDLQNDVNGNQTLRTIASKLIRGQDNYGQAFDETHDGNSGTDMADRLVAAFAGMTTSCARCHDHPLTGPTDNPRMDQNDVYAIYAFFATSNGGARKRNKLGQRFDAPLEPAFVLDGYSNAPANMPALADNLSTRRQAFADVFTASNVFARGTSHRIWAEIAAPLLDANEFLASNLAAVRSPALLAALTQLFKDQNTSLKGFLRQAMNSRLYQLSSAGASTAADAYQGRYVLRRQHAEAISKGVHQLVGLPYNGMDTSFRLNFGLPDTRSRSLLGGRKDEVGLTQALLQTNSPSSIAREVTNSGSQIRTLADAVDAGTTTLDAAVTVLVRQALSRNPTAQELTAIRTATAGIPSREALEDLGVALGNAAEFIFR